MPRYIKRIPSELRTFGDFLRDYKEESSFSERADLRYQGRTFGDFTEWLSKQPGDRFDRLAFTVGPRDTGRIPRHSPVALRAARAARRVRDEEIAADPLEGDVLSSPEVIENRNPTLSEKWRRLNPNGVELYDVQPENKVARNLRIAGKASAADGRMYDPNRSVRTIYGTMFDGSFHSKLLNPVHLRRLKRREVLFAQRRIGVGATRSNRARR